MKNPFSNSIKNLRLIPSGIWALGIVSLLMDASSELVHALLPVFLVSVLGTGTLTVGVIEGLAEAAASITKIFSGTLSDHLGRRKTLTVIGYGLAALTKPIFPLAENANAIFAARFVDRIGKGIRGAPRDALLADISPPELRGASFGLRQSLDTMGAVLGPLLAIGLMIFFGGDFRAVFWFASLPAALAIVVLIFAVREPPHIHSSNDPRLAVPWNNLGKLERRFWIVVAVGGILTLARFSEAFLVLRAQDIGLTVTWVPIIMVVMSTAYALSAYPAGALSDRTERLNVLGVGFAVLIIADLILATANSVGAVLAGAAIWGLHMGLTQGLLSALVADTAPKSLRGTAFGIFNFISGIILFAASVLAGFLWDNIGPIATFLSGAIITFIGLVGLFLVLRREAMLSSRA